MAKAVDWDLYAKQYDNIALANPAYLALSAEITGLLKTLDLKPGDLIIDLGCGTMLDDIAIAKELPDIEIVGVDNNPGMLEQAVAKLQKNPSLTGRVTIEDRDMTDVDGLVEKLGIKPAVWINKHSIYSLGEAKAKEVTGAIARNTPSGSYYLTADLGRVLQLNPGLKVDGEGNRSFDIGWVLYILNHVRKREGSVGAALKFFKDNNQGRLVNQVIVGKQMSGEYYTHSLPQYRDMVLGAGFEGSEVLNQSGRLYRGHTDLLVIRKS